LLVTFFANTRAFIKYQQRPTRLKCMMLTRVISSE